jgi:hypothetical protein
MSKRIFIDGDRFEAAISPSRSQSDIMDRKFGKGIVLLKRDDLEELGHVADRLQEGEPVLVAGARFEAYVNMDRTYADIIDRRHRGRLVMLDRAALEELERMVEEVLGVVV